MAVSNKTLALLLVFAMLFSAGATMLSLNKIRKYGMGSITGMGIAVDPAIKSVDLEAGSTSMMDLYVVNNGQSHIDELYAVVKIGQKGFKTHSTALNAFKSGVITAYVDTAGLEPGEHDIEITFYFDGNEEKVAGKANVG